MASVTINADSPDSALTLSPRCRKCGRPVTLAYRKPHLGEQAWIHAWTCPYSDCVAMNPLGLAGELLSATPTVTASATE